VRAFLIVAGVELVLLITVALRIKVLRRCHADRAAALDLIRRGQMEAARPILARWASASHRSREPPPRRKRRSPPYTLH
jgi:hypothetical protein